MMNSIEYEPMLDWYIGVTLGLLTCNSNALGLDDHAIG